MGLFKTKYGYFTDDGKEFVITTPRTPKPWINIICNGDFGTTISQTGSGYTWKTHASLNRITRWEQDLIKDEWGRVQYSDVIKCDDEGQPKWKVQSIDLLVFASNASRYNLWLKDLIDGLEPLAVNKKEEE